MKTHSLADVAAEHLPAEWKNPTRWLKMRLNRGELRGIRLGRACWRMSDEDITYMLTRYHNGAATEPVAAEPVSIVDGISARSRRRVRRSA